MSHLHCLPGSTLPGSWSEEPEPGIKPRFSDHGTWASQLLSQTPVPQTFTCLMKVIHTHGKGIQIGYNIIEVPLFPFDFEIHFPDIITVKVFHRPTINIKDTGM